MGEIKVFTSVLISKKRGWSTLLDANKRSDIARKKPVPKPLLCFLKRTLERFIIRFGTFKCSCPLINKLEIKTQFQEINIRLKELSVGFHPQEFYLYQAQHMLTALPQQIQEDL